MNAKDVIRNVVEFSHGIVQYYVADLSDSDLLVRSVPGSNHIAWQLGHMVGGTHQMLAMLGHQPPALPDGFVEAHGKETAESDAPAAFRTKAEYLALAEQMKNAALAAIDATPEAALDGPAPEPLREIAPTVGAMLALVGTHWLMHAGQFVPIRRKLGKPPLF